MSNYPCDPWQSIANGYFCRRGESSYEWRKNLSLTPFPGNASGERHRHRSQDIYIYRISNYLRILWRCSATLIPLTWRERERERDSQRSVMNCKSTRRRRTVSGSSAPLRLLALWIIYVKNKFTSCSSSISIPPRFYYHFSDELSPDYFPGSV